MSTEKFTTHDFTNVMNLSMNSNDSGYKVKGEVFWTLTDVENGSTTQGHFNNIVTLDAGILIARLMKSGSTSHASEPNYGIHALAVGAGDSSWNKMNPPPATATQRYLYSEMGRKSAFNSKFVKPDGTQSSIPTNIVDFYFEFDTGEATGAITEMGLIGGDVSSNMSIISHPDTNANGAYDNSVSLVGKDTLCNYVTFPVINKSATSRLTWTWRLTF